MRSPTRALILASAILSVASQMTMGAGEYSLKAIGYTGGIYVGSDGREFSSVTAVTPGGLILGISSIYSSSSIDAGTSSIGTDAWLYDSIAGTTTQMGLYNFAADSYGVAYISQDGRRSSSFSVFNGPGVTAALAAGYVVGTSTRYNSTVANNNYGTDAWIYHSGVNTLLGLTVAPTSTTIGYTASNGIRTTSLNGYNAVGMVIGRSSRYDNQNNTLGSDAWLYSDGTITPIGLTGASSDVGYTYAGPVGSSTLPTVTNNPSAINISGQVAGVATVFTTGGSASGFDAWVYDPTAATSTRIGLYGTGTLPLGGNNVAVKYQDGSGYRRNSVSKINDAGLIVGFTDVYDTQGSNIGTTPWIYTPAAGATPASTTIMGLYGANYIPSSGQFFSSTSSSPYNLNSIGQVVGTSNVFNGGSTNLGNDVWLYSKNTGTVKIFPTSPASPYIATDGTRFTAISFFNEGKGSSGGQVSGTARRYSGLNSIGTDAWYYNSAVANAAAIIVNLTAANNTSTSTNHTFYESTGGTRAATVTAMNNTGMVAGTSTRYSGTATAGQDAWIYDSSANTTYPIVLAVSGDTYNAISSVKYLSDSGYGFGIFTKYTGSTPNPGTYAFLWSPITHAAVDLNLDVTNLPSDAWDRLAQTFQITSAGVIVSYSVKSGDPAASSQTVTLLTPNGDATHDGLENIDDYLSIDVGYALHLKGWSNGDFNLDGTVDYKDYAILDASYALSHPLSADQMISLHASEFGEPYLAALAAQTVPEPGSLALLACGMTLCIRSRRMSRKG